MKLVGHIFFWLLLLLCGVGALVTATLQTQLGRDGIISLVEYLASRQEVGLKIARLSGNLPLSWELEQVTLCTPAGTLQVERVKARLALHALLKGSLSFSYLQMEGGVLDTHLPFSALGELSCDLDLKATQGALHIESGETLLTLSWSEKRSGECESLAQLSMPSATNWKEALSGYFHGMEEAQGINLQIAGFSHYRTLAELLHHGWKAPLSHPVRMQLLLEVAELPTPYPEGAITLEVELQWFGGYACNATRTELKSSFLGAEASWSSDLHGNLLSGQVQAVLPSSEKWNCWIKSYAPPATTASISLAGKTKLSASFDGTRQFVQFQLDGARSGPIELSDLAGILRGGLRSSWEAPLWQGELELSAHHGAIPLECKAELRIQKGQLIEIDNLSIIGPSTEVQGNSRIQLSPLLIEGDIIARLELQGRFQELFPTLYLSGSCALEARFRKGDDGQQLLGLHLLLHNCLVGATSVESASITAELTDPLGTCSGSISLDASHLDYDALHLAGLQMESFWRDGRWPFSIRLGGLWKQPLEAALTGEWFWRRDHLDLLLLSTAGNALGRPFSLKGPAHLQLGNRLRSLEGFALKMGQGVFEMGFLGSEGNMEAFAKALGLPIDLFSFLLPDSSFAGSCRFEARLQQENFALPSGQLFFTLEQMEMNTLGQKVPVEAKGVLSCHLERGHLQMHTLVRSREGGFLEGSATLPITSSLFHPSIQLEELAPLAAQLTVHGKIEEIFDFVELGFQRITGEIDGRMLFSGSWSSPLITGDLTIQEGSYENFFLGICLKQIGVEGKASQSELFLNHIRASTPKGGVSESLGASIISGAGSLSFHPAQGYPFALNLDLDPALILNLDTFRAVVRGNIELSGNSSEIKIAGKLRVVEIDYFLSEPLPTDYPLLPVTFLHAPPPRQRATRSSSRPIQYDLILEAEDHIFISGKGLKSVWAGTLHIAGENLNIEADGSLHCLRGEYRFAGRNFDLTQGEISFGPLPGANAHLNLTGSLAMRGMTLIAQLRGPLSAPILSFQSRPAMSTSEIIAYLLFGKPQAEVKPAEAVTLAQTIMSLSGGGGPDVLEAIRKKLGMDKLMVVSSKNRSDQISLQVGRYLTRGVLVSLSQSGSTSDVIVEAELKHGFTFEAESQDLQEGKFSLKWNCNY